MNANGILERKLKHLDPGLAKAEWDSLLPPGAELPKAYNTVDLGDTLCLKPFWHGGAARLWEEKDDWFN